MLSGLCFYISLNVNDVRVSKMFMILSVITILLIPIIILLKYIDKLLEVGKKKE
jgi:hypothetical protein